MGSAGGCALELLAVVDVAGILVWLLNALTSAVGLGMIIFVHELGHFAVAKWCGVLVERFSIGFGPVLWSRKWGETEYALSAVPFGGYVKMLGQDDMDPGQMTDEQVAADPRSYMSKTVLQRMAIISAGVIMNLITGWMFFSYAYLRGVKEVDARIGQVIVGMPAWSHGIRPGDTLTKINGRKVREFSDVMRSVALSSGSLEIEGQRLNGDKYSITINPDANGDRRRLGLNPSDSLEVNERALQVAAPNTPAEKAGFQPGDRIVAIGGVPINGWHEAQPVLYEKRAETLDITVLRAGQETKITVPPAPVKTLGLRLEPGKITAVRAGSPAAAAGFQVGDRLIKIEGEDVGLMLAPQRLPQYFYDRKGTALKVVVQREQPGGQPESRELIVTPDNELPNSEPAFDAGSPMSIPSLGLAFQFLPTVLMVEDGGPAARAGIKVGSVVSAVKFVKREGSPRDFLGDATVTVPVDGTIKVKGKIKEGGWPYALYELQDADARDIVLSIKDDANAIAHDVSIQPEADPEQFRATFRGLELGSLMHIRQAESFGDACQIGVQKTLDSITEVYLTIRSLVGGRMSVTNLHGPLGIAQIAFLMAKEGIAMFMLILGAISMNLAVINFLPIPVLDGGHMVFLIYEGLTGKKPSERVVTTATYAGLALVLSLMVTVIYLDLFFHR